MGAARGGSAILVALGAGLMIGIERERRMQTDQVAAAAGVRTYAITALLGVLAALSGSTGNAGRRGARRRRADGAFLSYGRAMTIPA